MGIKICGYVSGEQISKDREYLIDSPFRLYDHTSTIKDYCGGEELREPLRWVTPFSVDTTATTTTE